MLSMHFFLIYLIFFDNVNLGKRKSLGELVDLKYHTTLMLFNPFFFLSVTFGLIFTQGCNMQYAVYI